MSENRKMWVKEMDKFGDGNSGKGKYQVI